MADDSSLLHYTRSLIEASLDPFVTISVQGKIMDVNSATEKITGLPRERLIGSDFCDYFTDPERARAGYQQAFLAGYVKGFALAIRHVSGAVTEVLYNATVYWNEQGQIAGVFAAARDVTELKRAEDQLRAASHYARSLIEASLDPLVTISADGKIMDTNRATEKITGCPREKLIGSDFSTYFTEPEKARAGYQRVFSHGDVTDYPLVIRHVSGAVTDVLYSASIYLDESGNVAGVFAAARDITRLKRSQEELERTNREIRLLGQMTDLLQRCQVAEESYPIIQATMLQLFPHASGGCFMLNEAGTALEAVASWGSAPPRQKAFVPDDCWALRRGQLHMVGFGQAITPRCRHLQDESPSSVCVPLLAEGKTLGILYLGVDVVPETPGIVRHQRHLTETVADSVSLALANLRLRESLRSLSFHDPLTGLFNRRFMEETLARELNRMVRTQSVLVIAMLDIDRFKRFNDSFGHDAGDVVLTEVARLMQGFRSGSDVPCRFGGEEFILVLPDISIPQALVRLEQLRESISTLQVHFNGQDLPRITVSIGVAAFPTHGSAAPALIKAADMALYRAKDNGRNRIEVAEGPVAGLES